VLALGLESLTFFFFEKGKAQKGLELHSYHIRWGYKVNTGPERNENYRPVLQFSRKDPRKYVRKAIKSFFSSTGITRTPPPATLSFTGDETTWEE
jgi:hypothetical protein